MLPTIQIKDEFLTDKQLNILKSNIHKIDYKSMKNDCGNYGFRHFFEKNLLCKVAFY